MLGKSEQLIRGAVQEVLTCGTAKLRLGAPALELWDAIDRRAGTQKCQGTDSIKGGRIIRTEI